MNQTPPRASFTPPDENFRARVSGNFVRQSVMQTLGMSLFRIEPGEVEIRFAYKPELTQQHGFVHAGVMATALDSAAGYAAFSLMPAAASVLTVEFKVNLLSPAKGERFRVIGRVVKPGRTITVSHAEAYAETTNGSKLVAQLTGTLMAVYDRQEVTE